VFSNKRFIKPCQLARKTAQGSGGDNYDEMVIRWNDIPANTSAIAASPE
jgi:hypothetical protein